MRELNRLTTEYIEAEDRIRIFGELATDETVVMWLSQRLLRHLLPHLFLWLEKQSGDSIPSEIAQSFAQEAAQAEFATEAPVAQHPGSQEWLVLAVDINPSNEALRLGFRAKEEQQASLTLTPVALRQWLAILHTLWGLAEWPKELWPEWIKENAGLARDNVHSNLH